MNAFIQANTNGHLHDAKEPSISPLNRGFLYGDAIYEVWRTYEGVLFGWEEHWERLESSAAALYMNLPWTREKILAEIRRTVAEFHKHSEWRGGLYIRLQITRGAGPIGLDIALASGVDFVLMVQKCPQLSPEQLEQGWVLSIAQGIRRNPRESLSPAWKTGNYLNNLLSLREAKSRGADEVVILNLRGEITESAVNNIGFVRDGVMVMPPLDAGILAGVTRKIIMEKAAPMAGVKVVEEVVKPEDLSAMQECFLTGTTKDLVPVRAIDKHQFYVAKDSVTRRVKRAFADYVKTYVSEHESLRVDGGMK